MCHLKGWCVIKLLHLLVYGLYDFCAAMTGIDAPEAGACIKHLLAVDGGEVHIFGALQDARGRFELTVACKRHPEIGHVHAVGQAYGFGDSIHGILR